MSKKTVVSAPVKEAGKVNADILADYATSVGNLQGSEKEIEIAFVRSCVASGVSVRDLQASIKQGQADARLAGMRVLPSITTGKVQAFAKAITMLDARMTENGEQVEAVKGISLLTVKELLNLAQASPRLPEGFTVEGKTVQQVTEAIPPREESTKPKTDRKAPARKMSLTQIAEALDAYAEALPENLAEVPETDIVALAKIVKRLAALKRALAA